MALPNDGNPETDNFAAMGAVKTTTKFKKETNNLMSAITSIPAHYPREYATNWEQLIQQADSRLSEYVTMAPFEGKSKDFNQIGAVDWQAILGRARETVITDTPTGKRRLTQGGYDKASLFDEWDEVLLGQVSLPRSEVQVAHLNGWNRLKDAVIIAAALGDAVVPTMSSLGLETTTLVPLPSTQKVAIDYVETGSVANSSLTIGKLRQAKFLLDDSDADEDELRVIAITAKELQALLRVTEVTSADYANVKALVEGKVDTFMGFKFKRVSSKVMPASGSVRYIPAWVKSGVKMSTVGARAHMDVRIDLSHALQIRHTGLVGGVRMEEGKVVQIAIDSTLA